MRTEGAQPPGERSLAELAARQHGVVTRRQLADLGLAGGSIARRVDAGRLHRIHRGVYAVGHPRLTREARFMAAVLACGKGAALSHFSAAELWGLLPERGPRIDVTVPTRGGRKRHRLVIVHRAALTRSETARKDGIVLTVPTRTLVDLADVISQRRLERAIDEAAYLRLPLDGLVPISGRRGSGLLARVLDQHHSGTTRTRSELEEEMLSLGRRFGLPTPQVNAPVEGYTVDFAWPERRVIVETDGWQAHGTRSAFEDDRRRDAHLTAAGWQVMRITWTRLRREPEQLARLLARVLDT